MRCVSSCSQLCNVGLLCSHCVSCIFFVAERGLIGFEGSIVIVEGGNEALNVVPLPLMRVEGSYSQIAVKWQATAPLEFDYLLLAGCGEAAFNDGDTLASIPIELIPDWVESCTQPVSIKCELTQAHGGASLHHHHQVCELRLLPGEPPFKA